MLQSRGFHRPIPRRAGCSCFGCYRLSLSIADGITAVHSAVSAASLHTAVHLGGPAQRMPPLRTPSLIGRDCDYDTLECTNGLGTHAVAAPARHAPWRARPPSVAQAEEQLGALVDRVERLLVRVLLGWHLREARGRASGSSRGSVQRGSDVQRAGGARPQSGAQTRLMTARERRNGRAAHLEDGRSLLAQLSPLVEGWPHLVRDLCRGRAGEEDRRWASLGGAQVRGRGKLGELFGPWEPTRGVWLLDWHTR